MEDYKKDFIDFMLSCGVLKFGSFTLKSGRQSPFFMNAGGYVTGGQLKKLGEFYARAVHGSFGDGVDVFFGPAYKGIPLAVCTAEAYSSLYEKEVRYCSNRKEAKDHGADKGMLLGSPLHDGDRVVIIEDVTTSGKSIDETYPILMAQAKVQVVGEMVSLDRMERASADNPRSALAAISDKYGFPARAIVSMADVRERLDGTAITPELEAALNAYYDEWGARENAG